MTDAASAESALLRVRVTWQKWGCGCASFGAHPPPGPVGGGRSLAPGPVGGAQGGAAPHAGAAHLQRFGACVSRRYNDFVVFHDLLLQKFPYRMVPALPPKKMLGGTRAARVGAAPRWVPCPPPPPLSWLPLLPSSVLRPPSPVSLLPPREGWPSPAAVGPGALRGGNVTWCPGPLSLLLDDGCVRTSLFLPVAPAWGPGASTCGRLS